MEGYTSPGANASASVATLNVTGFPVEFGNILREWYCQFVDKVILSKMQSRLKKRRTRHISSCL